MQGEVREVKDPDTTVIGRIWYGLFELWIGDEEGTNNTLVDDWAHRIPLRIEDPDYLLNTDGSWDLGPYGEKGGGQWKLTIYGNNQPPEAQNPRKVLVEKAAGSTEPLIFSAKTQCAGTRHLRGHNGPEGIVLALGELFSPISPVNR